MGLRFTANSGVLFWGFSTSHDKEYVSLGFTALTFGNLRLDPRKAGLFPQLSRKGMLGGNALLIGIDWFFMASGGVNKVYYAGLYR